MKVHLPTFVKFLEDPITPNPEHVEQFNTLYEKEYGIRLEEPDAYNLASAMLSFGKMAMHSGIRMELRERLATVLNEIRHKRAEK